MSESVHQFIADLVAAWNSHNIDRAAEFYAPDYVGSDWGQSSPQRGRAGIRAFLTQYLSAFPDMRFLADETIIDGNRVALAWTGERHTSRRDSEYTGDRPPRLDPRGLAADDRKRSSKARHLCLGRRRIAARRRSTAGPLRVSPISITRLTP